MSEDIFEKINNDICNIKEDSLKKWIIPSLIDQYNIKLKYLTVNSYGINIGADGFDLAFKSFKGHAEEKLHDALVTFLFKKQHWQNNRPLKPYLSVVLDNLSTDLYWKYSSATKTKAYICPLCNERSAKEILIKEDGLLKCNACTAASERCLESIAKGIDIQQNTVEYMLTVGFSKHSKEGFKCPDCLRFIPSSFKNNSNLSCPYGDCHFFGSIDILNKTNHPIRNTVRSIISINEKTFNGTAISGNAEQFLLVSHDLSDKIDLIYEVIKAQRSEVLRNASNLTKIQKSLMYDAFKILVDKQPDDMVHYLCYRKQISEPLQAKIFQEYARLVELNLPFVIGKANKKIEIVSLTDPNLSLFRGISEYDSYVQDDNTIPNETKEEYIGGISYSSYGPCFIGRLIDVIDKTSGLSILDNVKEYSFSKIIMNEDVKSNTPVHVEHFRILSHYEMDSLVHLQRIRKRIVDSIYFRLFNKKRNNEL